MRLTTVGAAVTIGAVVMAPVVMPSDLAAQSAVVENSFDWSGRMPAGATLRIADFDGPIHVSASTDGQVEVHGERRSGRGPVVFERIQSGEDVTVCAYRRDEGSCSARGMHEESHWHHGWHEHGQSPTAEFTVRIPPDVHLATSTGDGAIDIRGAGDVVASSGDGEISVEGVRGAVDASSGDGPIQITTSGGPVNASTGDGDIEVRLAAVAGARDMRFSTGDGRITLYVPAAFGGEIDADTGDGEVVTDFPLRVEGRLDPHHVRATFGSGGGPRITLSTGDGNIELRKQ